MEEVKKYQKYLFSIALVTNYHELGDLKHYRSITLPFRKSRVHHGLAGLYSF